MSSHRPSRTYDAERTKKAILDAAEKAFAQHGFSGARIDAIARDAGYNKSLIYQYFGDKLALYTEVVKRADSAGDALLEPVVDRVGGTGFPARDADAFREFIEATVETTLTFLVQQPRYLQILFWEAADEWKTWNRITYKPDDADKLVGIVKQAREQGIVRADFDPAMFPVLIMSATAATLRFSHRFGNWWQGEQTPAKRQHMIDQVSSFVVHGLLEPTHL